MNYPKGFWFMLFGILGIGIFTLVCIAFSIPFKIGGLFVIFSFAIFSIGAFKQLKELMKWN